MRVHEYAKQLNLSSKEVLQFLSDNNLSVKSHMSVLGDDVILMLDKNFKNEKTKMESQVSNEKDSTNDTDDLFKYDEYVEVKRPKITKKKKANQKKSKNDKSDRIANVPVKEDKDAAIVYYSDELTVGDLAERLGKSTGEIVKQLLMLGMMATVNQTLDRETVELLAEEAGFEVKDKIFTDVTEFEKIVIEDSEEDLEKRPPVVTIMGHVDHGKTTLLDAIRNSRVVTGEAGGITQHIGAYQVNHGGSVITFLDTPGHAAFTSMRARGAQVTDICVLVVASDDGVMPQTKEAIDHAKAAGVPIIVAINKMDKPTANPERVMQELLEFSLVPEEWGGDTIYVKLSALQGEGIDDLLEMINLVSEMNEYKANPKRLATGTVIEAKLDKGRGPVATLLVENGTLRIGDAIVVGNTHGRVRAMVNDLNQRIEAAGPSTPIEITGLNDVPQAGDRFMVFPSEKEARQIADQRTANARELGNKPGKAVSLDDLFSQIQEGEMKELNVIIKGDVQGSVEALSGSLQKIDVEGVKINIIRASVGTITETDVTLAAASGAIIIGFNVRPSSTTRQQAANEGVDIRLHSIIYKVIEEIEAAMKGMLDPIFEEKVTGQLEVRQTFKVSKVGTIAGCYVTDGSVSRNASVRVIRDGIVVFEGELGSLKRFKDEVKEVNYGYECGITIERYNDIKEGDIIEAYVMEEVKRA
ncbi:translation initiation factor IF-2 [Turicibacter bilis]|uniref:Translation initiation factor IF-2 n=1 Tax=Turicibacter bilis TaxID=2735723 RepID=A0ABY5JKF6_9FIRM|nr:translation initiation factor IF-2 [Turicibacter bilis]MDD5985463.1 translation initiation factor IF-2 [Turicibacter sp.]CUN98727.1 Translation initiation factor IF-2 [Turicibacter sanguinis]MBS3200244.1 translation initiation factor IF-2 [Turicibacter bilis]MBS3203717.1 translation initiation factor IF-2 [Turicibacter bilis]MDY4816260.1 translation initiation factor IF-2 [Turicibacter bilis]